MSRLNWLKNFGKLKVKPTQERLQCKRCLSIAYTPLERAKHNHYAPYCSDNCLAWAELLEKEAA